MSSKEHLTQLRISAASRLKHICVDIALMRKSKQIDNALLSDYKMRRTNMDKLINKIDNAIINNDYNSYNDYYQLFKSL